MRRISVSIVKIVVCCVAWLMVFSAPGLSQTTITLSMWAQNNYWLTLFEKFHEEHPDIRIEFVQRPFNEYFDAILTMYAAGNAPDIIVSNPQNAITFIEGIWRPLDDLIARDGFDFSQYHEGGWAYGRYNGRHYAWPAGVNPPFPSTNFFFNRDMFAAAGVPDLTPEWTFADYRDLSVRLTLDRNGDGQIDQYGTLQPNHNWYWDWVWSNGGDILDETHTQFLLMEDNALEALQFLVDMRRNHFGGTIGGQTQDHFIGGRVAIANLAFAVAINLAAQGAEFDWSIMSNPRGKAGSIGRGGDLPMGINAQSSHVEEAWTFFKWAVREDVQRWAALEAGVLSAPVHMDVLRDADYRLRPGPPYDFTPLFEMQARYQPLFERWVELDRLIVQSLAKASTGVIDVQGALEEIRPSVDALLRGN